MTINLRVPPLTTARWKLCWQWALFSLIAITVANLLYNQLPTTLVNPRDDENIWMEQAWRIAIINCVYYTPISLAQWLVLQRYVRRSWLWPLVTLGSVVLIYPASIWVLYSRGYWDAAWLIWFPGMGGITVFVLAQWIALLRWTRTGWIYGIGLITTAVGWYVILSVIALFRSTFGESMVDGGLVNLAQTVVYSSIYQLLIGGALAIIFPTTSEEHY